MSGPIIGIDLGTTNSCVAVVTRSGLIEIAVNEKGERTTPSYVAFTGKERMVGENAKQQIADNPQNTVYDVKRLIGRTFNDPSIKNIIKNVPYPYAIVEDDDKLKIGVTINGKKLFCPEEISAMILSKLKDAAEKRLGEKVTDAIISVPAYFNNAQRCATMDAGKIAGLHVHRIINEPTAVAYGLNTNNDNDNSNSMYNVLVFDLGGGTFDVSIVNINKNLFMVKSTAGNSNLGGRDFDNALVKFCKEEFERKNKGIFL